MKQTNIIIAPSILAANWGNFAGEIKAVTSAGADWIHIDVMDGRFVPPITFGADIVNVAQSTTKLPLDVHLMIVEPERQVENFAKAGATSITIHLEACPHLQRNIQQIKAMGCKAGVALNPATSIKLVENVLDQIDILLLMTVNPGWGGQKFIAGTLKKIREASEMITQNGLSTVIEVDGGITKETATAVVAAGATVLVAGTSIFHSSDYKEAIDVLKESVAQR